MITLKYGKAKLEDIISPTMTEKYEEDSKLRKILNAMEETRLKELNKEIENYYGLEIIEKLMKKDYDDYLKHYEKTPDAEYSSFTDALEETDFITYKNLSEFNSKDDIIIDIGCWYGIQSMFFDHTRLYIGVEHFGNWFVNYTGSNKLYFKMEGLKFLKEVLPCMGLPLEKIFIISNLVVDKELNEYIMNNFKNYYIHTYTLK